MSKRMGRDVSPLGIGDGKTRPRLRAVGIGGAGCNAIAICPFDAVSLCSSQDAYTSPPQHRRVVLDDDSVRMIRSMSPRLLSSMDHKAVRLVEEALGESDMIFLFTGLGGETGSYLTPGIAQLARRKTDLVVVSAALPFSVEGPGRRDTAVKALPGVLEAAHATITYPNDGLLKLTPNLPLRKAFRVMDTIMMFPAMELARVLTRDDLVTLRHDLAQVSYLRLGMGEGGGINGEAQAVAEAFTSPWFDRPFDKVTLAVVAVTGREIDQYTIKALLDKIIPRIPNAKIRYAGRTDPEGGDRVRVMLLLGFAP